RVDGGDVRVVHGGGGAGFARETLPRQAVVRQVGGEHFDRHPALQRGVKRLEHHAHAALAQQSRHLVVVELAQGLGRAHRTQQRRYPCRLLVRAVYEGKIVAAAEVVQDAPQRRLVGERGRRQHGGGAEEGRVGTRELFESLLTRVAVVQVGDQFRLR